MTREIPLVGGPGDGERASVPDSGVVLPSVRWHGPDPDAPMTVGFDLAGSSGDALAFAVPGVQAVYHHLVATRHDPHPCRRRAVMVAEWDAYVWDQVQDLRVDGHAMGIPPSRFRVTGAPPRIGPDVFGAGRRPWNDPNANVRADLLAAREFYLPRIADPGPSSPHPSADRPRGLE